MVVLRKKLQGVWNIVRFNYHQYLILLLVLLLLLFLSTWLSGLIQDLLYAIILLSILQVLISLLISYYIYDYSDLYKLNNIVGIDGKKVLNINAGFDETSDILLAKFPKIKLIKADFYNPEKHTEVSIKRARRAYPSSSETRMVNTESLPFENNSFDQVICIFSAHEIRNQNERISFLKEINRITQSSGDVIIIEHIRDVPNFLAYNIGFMHFYSKSNWKKCFNKAGLVLSKEVKSTQFVSIFNLKPKNAVSI